MNYTALLVAAVVSFIIGMLRYSPMLFGKMYMKAAGHHGDGNKGNMMGMMVMEFIFNLVTVRALSRVLTSQGVTEMNDALMSAGVIRIGFILVTTWSNQMRSNGSAAVLWISSLCRLVTLMAAAAILLSI